MKGGIRAFVTSSPLNTPIAVPNSIPMGMAIKTGNGGISIVKKPSGIWAPNTAKRPMIIEVVTSMAPTERSIPAVKIMIVWAIAIMPVIVTCFRIRDKVLADMKFLAISPKTKTLTTKMMAGIAVGFARKKLRTLDSKLLSSLSKLATFL